MLFYEYFLVYTGIALAIIALIRLIIALISHIDYKRQISGKRAHREYKGDVSYDVKENYNVNMEIERASREKLTEREMYHRI